MRRPTVTSKILLSGGCVLTLGAKTPNFTKADVLIDGGVVAEVGPGLRARDAEQVDATDTIVMPGFVDTHRHAWTSLFRNLGEPAWSGEAPVPPAAVGDHYQPEDVYAATLIGLLGAAEAGITTVVDWSLIRSDDGSADAALQAHADAGLRTVFVHAARPSAATHRSSHRRGRTVDQHRLRVRPARVDRSRQGRRRVGAGPGVGPAHPRPRRFGELGAWRDRRRRPSGGSWAKTSRSSIARSSTTPMSTPSRRPGPRCRWRPRARWRAVSDRRRSSS